MIAYTPKSIMINWLQRDFRFTEDEACDEIRFLYTNDLPITYQGYLKTRRIGATKVLDRKTRSTIYMSFMRSFEHASFVAK